MDLFFDVLNEYMSDELIINNFVIEGKKEIIIEENASNTKLKKVKLECNQNCQVFAFTLDPENFQSRCSKNSGISCSKKGMQPYFKDIINKSSDAILVVKYLEKMYLILIELKSENVKPKEILMKHIYTKYIVKHMLETLYTRCLFENRKITFPDIFFGGMIVFYKRTTALNKVTARNEENIKFSEYKCDLLGNYKNELKYYKYPLNDKNMNNAISLEKLLRIKEIENEKLIMNISDYIKDN